VTTAEPAPPRGSAVRATAGIVLVSLALAWLILGVLDLDDNDGVGPNIALFGIPALASALIIQAVIGRLPASPRPQPAVLWWTLVVLPAGILAGFGVAILRDPDYFIGDDSPWMLVWIPILVGAGLLLGAVVWFFAVFPIATLLRLIPPVIRGDVDPTALLIPLVVLALGVVCVIGGLSIDTDGTGRAAWGAIIASLLGLPGAYEVRWPPGLWIVRGLVLAVVLATAGPGLLSRIRRRAERRAP
jgi:hypothetical protein